MGKMVSIICLTYNHEPYIADAIEGFLRQKTNFDFEILIGEDHSQDGTLKIIESYKKKYPDKIKIITSSENVGAKANALRIIPHVKGKYIALCEGDDYWTDILKLQKQVDYMEAHPACTLCFHNADVVDYDKSLLGRRHIPWTKQNAPYYYGENHEYNVGELALLDFIPTASLLIRTTCMSSLPEFFYEAVAGDIVIRLAVTSKGYAYYIDDVMSAYRTNVPQSATNVMNNASESIEGKMAYNKKFIYLLDEIDKYTNRQYSKELERAKINRWEGPLLVEQGRLKELKSERYRSFFNSLDPVSKMKCNLKYYAPTLFGALKSAKKYINR